MPPPLAAIAPLLLVCGLLAAQSNQPQLPPGPSRDRLVRLCVGCHDLDLVMARRHSRAEWQGVVEDMIARGAEGSREELTLVADYLSRNLGRVSVNLATAGELEDGLQISAHDARAIAEWRDAHGKFLSLEEVRKVPGVDAATIAQRRGWMSFE